MCPVHGHTIYFVYNHPFKMQDETCRWSQWLWTFKGSNVNKFSRGSQQRDYIFKVRWSIKFVFRYDIILRIWGVVCLLHHIIHWFFDELIRSLKNFLRYNINNDKLSCGFQEDGETRISFLFFLYNRIHWYKNPPQTHIYKLVL